MRLRNDDHGYGLVTKTVHWLTFALLVVQFTIGYLIVSESGHGRGHGRGGESGRGRGGGNDDSLLPVHITIGSLILLLAVVRLVWRLTTPLPPWSDRLSEKERTVENRVEQLLILMLFLTPASGIALVLGLGEDDLLLPLHIACHVVFYAAIAVHVALAVRRRTVQRMLTVGP